VQGGKQAQTQAQTQIQQFQQIQQMKFVKKPAYLSHSKPNIQEKKPIHEK